ncbi:MAG: hypothetical protein KBD21_03460 [Candidatus Pacebacteria bacterium]|nr:hypothetical protein [Candidatus Paceibacterota bacterium]
MRLPFFSPKRRTTLTLEEVMLDAHTASLHQEKRLEGRLTLPVPRRALVPLLLLIFVVFGTTVVRAGQLMVIDGGSFRALSENNRLNHTRIPAERGNIYDRNGVLLASNEVTALQTSAELYHERSYVVATGTSHILGYVRMPARDERGFFYREGIEGIAGVERAYDALLRGSDGVKIVETDVHLDTVSEGWVERPVSGTSLTLSIDTRVQAAMHQFIGELATDVPFTGGAGVLMDVHTGEIIALTSVPEYSSEALVSGDAERIAGYVNDFRTPYLNRVLAGQYTPGSIVKPFLAAAALTEGIVRPDTTFLSTGALRLANPYAPGQFSVFTDWRAHGSVNLRRALAVSSNIYFYYVGGGYGNQPGLGIARIEEYMKKFGFGLPTGVALEGEVYGTIPSPRWKAETFPNDPVWRIGNTYHTSIGQYGFQVTPLQAVRAVAALANGGVLLTPRIEKEHTSYGAREVGIPEEHLAVVREGMRLAVTEGIARGLDVDYLDVAGKTGTAEIGTDKSFVHSWVMGFYPFEEPRYAFVVMMEHGPRTNLIGATSVMRRLLDWMHVHTPEYLEH